jgi:cytosine/adenosine deaminase-related metal-dependent hydrolase
MVTYRARYVFPVDQLPIENGEVTFDRGLILAVGRHSGEADAIDLGDVAIIPGLVNAHTHLEFSDLKQPLGDPGMSLPVWIRHVIRCRESASTSEKMYRIDSGDPAELGLRESVRYGITAIGEVAQQQPILPGVPLDITVFLELRAPRAFEIPMAMHFASAVGEYSGGLYRPGLSPHAPYTVHPKLLEALVDLSSRERLPLAMHIAESPEELQYLRDATGPFRELLESYGAWEPGAVLPNSSPLEYLKLLSRGARALVIHGNYLNQAEVECLAMHANSMSVIYCPRTHVYFGHKPYSLHAMLDSGVQMALGTDSRASNPDLDLRKEMQFVIDRHGIASEQALRLGTINGAMALGLEKECGTISPGKSANFAIMQLAHREAADPHELLFDPMARVVATICRGQAVFSEHPAIV